MKLNRSTTEMISTDSSIPDMDSDTEYELVKQKHATTKTQLEKEYEYERDEGLLDHTTSIENRSSDDDYDMYFYS